MLILKKSYRKEIIRKTYSNKNDLFEFELFGKLVLAFKD